MWTLSQEIEMKIIVGIVGSLVVLGAGSYASICYTVGDTFVKEYTNQLSAKAGPLVDVDQGVFSSTVTSNHPVAGPMGGLKVVTNVDHMVTPDRWLISNTTIGPDDKLATAAKSFFTKSPTFTFTTEVHMDQTKTISGSLPPTKTKPNPLANFTMRKPIKVSAVIDKDDNPQKMSLSVPGMKFNMGKMTAEISGLSFSNNLMMNGDKAIVKSNTKASVLKFSDGMPGSSDIRLGPVDLRVTVSGVEKDKLGAMGGGALGLSSALNKPGVSIAFTKSSAKTNFGSFEIDGKIKSQMKAGKPSPKGKLDIKVPATPRAYKVLGPTYAAIMKVLISRKLVKRSRGHVKAKLAFDGDTVRINGKSLDKHMMAIAMAAQSTKGGKMPAVKAKSSKSKLLSKDRKGSKKRRKRLKKKKLAH